MSVKSFIRFIFVCIGLYILICCGFSVYEWIIKNNANKSIDKVLPIGEYINEDEVLLDIKPNENIYDHTLLHPKFLNTLQHTYGGFNYKYSLSGVRAFHYLARSEDGSIHSMTIWPQTVLTKSEIYYVRDVDSLIVALNKAYPLLSKELNFCFPNRVQKTYAEIDKSLNSIDSIMINLPSCTFSKETCPESIGIPIDVGDYRIIFDGKCRQKKVVSLYPSFYKAKSTTLWITGICAIILIFFLFIVTLQQQINKHRTATAYSSESIKNKRIPSSYIEIKNQSVSKFYCKNCGKMIDDDSEYCSYCGMKQH